MCINSREVRLVYDLLECIQQKLGLSQLHPWCVQSQRAKRISTDDFIIQGLLSLCLRSLASQDEGLR